MIEPGAATAQVVDEIARREFQHPELPPLLDVHQLVGDQADSMLATAADQDEFTKASER